MASLGRRQWVSYLKYLLKETQCMSVHDFIMWLAAIIYNLLMYHPSMATLPVIVTIFTLQENTPWSSTQLMERHQRCCLRRMKTTARCCLVLTTTRLTCEMPSTDMSSTVCIHYISCCFFHSIVHYPCMRNQSQILVFLWKCRYPASSQFILEIVKISDNCTQYLGVSVEVWNLKVICCMKVVTYKLDWEFCVLLYVCVLLSPPVYWEWLYVFVPPPPPAAGFCSFENFWTAF